VGDFTVLLNGVKVTDDGQKQMITADTTVFRDGKELTRMYPARWFYRKHEEEPTTEVAIRRGFAEDLYLVMPAFSVEDQSASMGIIVNPLVNWVWAGFGVLAIGTGIALLPETVFSFALASMPAGAATTTMLLLSLLLWPSTLLAQGKNVQVTERSALHRQLENEIICTCGCRHPVGSCGMLNCPGHASQTAKLQQFLAEGKDHDAVLAAFVQDFGGQDVLTAPIDKGFNRLAWLFPYLVALAGLIGVVVTARRWSSRPSLAAAGDAALDPTLNARLDDELRNLD
jgi:cytochrome c-type biogenesis protein CcmH/NrfF